MTGVITSQYSLYMLGCQVCFVGYFAIYIIFFSFLSVLTMMFRGGQRLAGAVRSRSAVVPLSDKTRNESRSAGTMSKFGLPARYGQGEQSVW